MDWVLQSPQLHSTFSNLGFAHTDGYHINENCDTALETILHNIVTEDKYLRNYRRGISFGQNIKKDLVPLLLHAKDDRTIELLIKIFVNLTTPIECLFNVEDISQSEFGRHTVFEINNLLSSAKSALTDHRATKVIIEFLKKNAAFEENKKLSVEQCTNINNTLLFLRNILHIPDDVGSLNPNYTGPTRTVQNQILWNLFSQSIDKVLIKLMTILDAAIWGVTMVQLIALLYKDQHVTTLHKLLNVWLETSLSESSDDNESNTSPPNRGTRCSNDSSPMVTSDPTSDSSDTGGNGKCATDNKLPSNGWEANWVNLNENSAQPAKTDDKTIDKPETMDFSRNNNKDGENTTQNLSSQIETAAKSKIENKPLNTNKKGLAENSDCGYGTQIENQESISTSSNEEDLPSKKPIHQKPHGTKQRVNNKSWSPITPQERRRKKIVKRGKSNIINVHGLSHSMPTDDDISNVLKEFTVDFLLKGFNSLVKTIHNQILTNHQLEIDTSHFFWLVTYFLKFATQIELDLERVCSVLSYDIVSYLTSEGVNICEQFELAIKLDDKDLKPSIRRLHLVVTAIREFVQAIEVYKKSVHLDDEDQQTLMSLQMKMCETEELRSLLVLLLRHYNPKYHTKQYLQDLIVTNHILLIFLDNLMRSPEYKGGTIVDHVKQFATPQVMYQYGLLLEDYEKNGEFINDCIFTVMHHVGGDLDCLISLFQPNILKTFTSIWKSEFEIGDDWSDLIEFVVNTFVKKPHTLHSIRNFRLEPENFEDEKVENLPENPSNTVLRKKDEKSLKRKSVSSKTSTAQIIWSEDEISSLSWIYMQNNTLPDVVGEIVRLFNEDGIIKSRESVIKELLKQSLIKQDEFERLMKSETENYSNTLEGKIEMRDGEIAKLCEQLKQDDKSKFLDWVQTVLLEACNVKIYLDKSSENSCEAPPPKKVVRVMDVDGLVIKQKDMPAMSSVSYHSLLANQSIPLVPWNCDQATVCKDLKFLQLLHKLGFQMPVDTGKVFIRIPNFWTPDILYEVAAKISPIDTSKLKFSLRDISASSVLNSKYPYRPNIPGDHIKGNIMNPPCANFYKVQKQKHVATVVNFTPMPGSSFNTSGEQAMMTTPNWLEMVQKSQDYKINLDIHRTIITNDVEMPSSLEAPDAPMPLQPELSAIVDTLLGAPPASSFDMHPTVSEFCNNSVCETASVASDLTRMYVSDEEDKPDDRPILPSTVPAFSPPF